MSYVPSGCLFASNTFEMDWCYPIWISRHLVVHDKNREKDIAMTHVHSCAVKLTVWNMLIVVDLNSNFSLSAKPESTRCDHVVNVLYFLRCYRSAMMVWVWFLCVFIINYVPLVSPTQIINQPFINQFYTIKSQKNQLFKFGTNYLSKFTLELDILFHFQFCFNASISNKLFSYLNPIWIELS